MDYFCISLVYSLLHGEVVLGEYRLRDLIGRCSRLPRDRFQAPLSILLLPLVLQSARLRGSRPRQSRTKPIGFSCHDILQHTHTSEHLLCICLSQRSNHFLSEGI